MAHVIIVILCVSFGVKIAKKLVLEGRRRRGQQFSSIKPLRRWNNHRLVPIFRFRKTPFLSQKLALENCRSDEKFFPFRFRVVLLHSTAKTQKFPRCSSFAWKLSQLVPTEDIVLPSITAQAKMVKKSGSKNKRGIRQGVQRHRIRPQGVRKGRSFLEKALNTVGTETHHVSHAAKLCFRYTSKVCTLFSLIPLQTSAGSIFDRALFPKQVFHHLLVTFYVLFTIYKLCVTVYLLIYEGLNVSAVMCAGSFSLSFFSICASSGSSWTPSQMRDLLNSWQCTMANIRSITGKHIGVFGSIPVCLKSISVVLLSNCTPLNLAAFSLVSDEMPTSIFFMANKMSLIPENVLPNIFWQVALYPLELLALYPPMCSTAFNGLTFVIGLAVLGLYAEQLRYDQLLPNGFWVYKKWFVHIMCITTGKWR